MHSWYPSNSKQCKIKQDPNAGNSRIVIPNADVGDFWHFRSSEQHADGTNRLPSSCKGGSVAEWLACWTQTQKGSGSNRSRDAVG